MGATFSIISAVAGGLSAAKSLGIIGGGNKGSSQMAAPLPPGTDPAAQAERDAASEAERRKRMAGSRSALNPTGGLGDASQPSLSAKSLLGA